MITIIAPLSFEEDRRYIIEVFFDDILGVEHELLFSHRQDWLIQVPDSGEIILPDVFFENAGKQWLSFQSLPKQPLEWWWRLHERGLNSGDEDEIPIIYGQKDHFSLTDQEIRLPIDIFGSAFFMLTRYEEVVKPERDEHDRFSVASSLAFQEGFLHRPVVNGYAELLWSALKRLAPSLNRRERSFRVLPTHDVDEAVSYHLHSLKRLILVIGADILKRKSPAAALKHAREFYLVRKGRQLDPVDTFDWIMKESENAGLKSAFYFKTAKNGPFDDPYLISDPRVQSTMDKIHARGHEIGFHPGYETAFDKRIWEEEYCSLKSALPANFRLHGGRQHYLRFSVPETLRIWSASELVYDSSLGYADHPGFRCGICYPFPLFDVCTHRQLDVFERPLIMMERSVIDDDYLGMGMNQISLDYMLSLKERCKIFNGDFIFLWHNNNLTSDIEKELYRALLNG